MAAQSDKSLGLPSAKEVHAPQPPAPMSSEVSDSQTVEQPYLTDPAILSQHIGGEPQAPYIHQPPGVPQNYPPGPPVNGSPPVDGPHFGAMPHPFMHANYFHPNAIPSIQPFPPHQYHLMSPPLTPSSIPMMEHGNPNGPPVSSSMAPPNAMQLQQAAHMPYNFMMSPPYSSPMLPQWPYDAPFAPPPAPYYFAPAQGFVTSAEAQKDEQQFIDHIKAFQGQRPPPEIAQNIICRFFPDCRYGSSCIFLHPSASQRATEASERLQSSSLASPANPPPATSGHSLSADSRDSRHSSKTQMAHQINEGTGSQSVTTAGDAIEMNNVSVKAPASRRNHQSVSENARSGDALNANLPACTFFASHRCRNGDSCRFPHILADGSDARDPKLAGTASSRKPGNANEGNYKGPRGSDATQVSGKPTKVLTQKLPTGPRAAERKSKFQMTATQKLPRAEDFPLLDKRKSDVAVHSEITPASAKESVSRDSKHEQVMVPRAVPKPAGQGEALTADMTTPLTGSHQTGVISQSCGISATQPSDITERHDHYAADLRQRYHSGKVSFAAAVAAG